MKDMNLFQVYMKKGVDLARYPGIAKTALTISETLRRIAMEMPTTIAMEIPSAIAVKITNTILVRIPYAIDLFLNNVTIIFVLCNC